MERLDLKFRAEPNPPPRLAARGWWLWCLVGLVIGLGSWWLGRRYLARRLSDQLATAQSPSEAFLALEGLLMLDASATLEIVRGLQHPNPQIARTAYRTLDAQITGWQQLEASTAITRMRSLAQRLNELPETTPPDNIMLASSLASRIFTICLELDDPKLAPVMTLCENVFQRIGQKSLAAAQASAAADQELVDLENQINSLRPPPPLDPAPSLPATNATTASINFGDESSDSLRDVDARPDEALRDPVAGPYTAELSPPTLAPVTSRDATFSSSGEPTAKVQFLTSATRPRTPSIEHPSASVSLSDSSPASFSLSDEEPEVVATPDSAELSLATSPLPRMQQTRAAVDLNSINDLAIDQLVRLLGSTQPGVAQTAALALKNKNMPDDRLALASELATSAPTHQIELLEEIATRGDLDPRPWLLWLAEDGEPEVRKQAIVLLSSMLDLNVQRDLRQLLAKERDESVAQSIRYILLNQP